jgi:hypothetical protein
MYLHFLSKSARATTSAVSVPGSLLARCDRGGVALNHRAGLAQLAEHT